MKPMLMRHYHIPADDVEWLAILAETKKVTRASLVRKAISEFLKKNRGTRVCRTEKMKLKR